MNSCIYKIESKTHPNRFYIGSAIRFNIRKGQHRYDLKNNKHGNGFLQNHSNKYGIDDLIFKVLEWVGSELLEAKEQEYIDLLKPPFNIRKIAKSNLGFAHSELTKEKLRVAHKGRKHRLGAKHSIESKNKMSIAKKNVIQTVEQRRKNSLAQMGNKRTLGYRHSAESKLKIAEASKRMWSNPDKKIMISEKIKLSKKKGFMHYTESNKENPF